MNDKPKQNKFSNNIKIIALLLCFTLIFEQTGFAQVAGQLDLSSKISNLINSSLFVYSRPPHLRYISYDKANQSFKVILNKEDSEKIRSSELTNSVRDPLKFFYTGLAIPNESFWVNLRPDSADKIIDDYLAMTDVGKILLEADLELKKDLARATFPSTSEGKEYWNKIYNKIEEVYGYDSGNVSTSINARIWITPGEVIVCEDQNSAYIYKAALNVSTEAAYLSNKQAQKSEDNRALLINDYSSKLMQELILPKISKEVNTGKKYAALRQVYYSLILAQWFKRKFYGAGGLYPYLIDRRNLTGLTSDKRWTKDTYFKEYKKSLKEKEYDLQVQVFNLMGRSVRTYSTGGVDLSGIFPGANYSQAGASSASLTRDIPTDLFSPPLTDQAASLELINQGTMQDPYFSRSFSVKTLRNAIPFPQASSPVKTVNTAPIAQQLSVSSQPIVSVAAGNNSISSPASVPVSTPDTAAKITLGLSLAAIIPAIVTYISSHVVLAYIAASLPADATFTSALIVLIALHPVIAVSIFTFGIILPIIIGLAVIFSKGKAIAKQVAVETQAVPDSDTAIARDSQPTVSPILIETTLAAQPQRVFSTQDMAEGVKKPEAEHKKPRVPLPVDDEPAIPDDTPISAGWVRNVSIADLKAIAGSAESEGRHVRAASVRKIIEEREKAAALRILKLKDEYAKWLADHSDASTRNKIDKTFSLYHKELFLQVGEALKFNALDAKFIKGLVDFVVSVASTAPFGNDANQLRIEAEQKIELLLNDKEALLKEIDIATETLRLKNILADTLLVDYNLEKIPDLNNFLNEQSIQYHNAFVWFTFLKLDLAWVEYKKQPDSAELRVKYNESEDKLIAIEKAVYEKISETIPGLRDSLSAVEVKEAKKNSSGLRNTIVSQIGGIALLALALTGCVAPSQTHGPSMTPQEIRIKTVNESRQLLTVDQQAIGGVNGEIIQVGLKKDASKIDYLRGVMNHIDDSAWEVQLPSLLIKGDQRLDMPGTKPQWNMELQVGKLLELLQSGVMHVLAQYNEQEPSLITAAEWSLGQMASEVKSELTKRMIINDLIVHLKDRNVAQAAAAAEALSYYTGINEIVPAPGAPAADLLVKPLVEALTYNKGKNRWFARYQIVKTLLAIKDGRTIQPIIDLADNEEEPVILALIAEGAFKLDSAGALLPVIRATERLNCFDRNDKKNSAINLHVWNSIVDGLVKFGEKDPTSRRQAIFNYFNAVQNRHFERGADKYDQINFNYIPIFEKLVKGLKINRQEIESDLSKLDKDISGPLSRVLDPPNANTIKAPYLLDAQDSYMKTIGNYKRDDPEIAKEIKSLEDAGNISELCWIVVFDQDSPARRVLATDALSRINDTSSIRAIFIALNDSHHAVRSAAARILRDYVSRFQFIYTGKDGKLVKSLEKAVSDKDWVTTAYLLDTLSIIGDSDALEVISKFLDFKNPLIHKIVMQLLEDFSRKGDLQEHLIKLLDPEVSDFETLKKALKAAGESLRVSDNKFLTETVINILLKFPGNPEEPSSYELRTNAIEALRNSKYSYPRLKEIRENERNTVNNDNIAKNYNRINLINTLLEELSQQTEPEKPAEGKKDAENTNESVNPDSSASIQEKTQPSLSMAQEQSLDKEEHLTFYLSVLFDANKKEEARLDVLFQMGINFKGTGNILAKQGLLKLLENESSSEIIKKAMRVFCDIDNGKNELKYPKGQNPFVAICVKIANDGSQREDVREEAINALGKTANSEAAKALAQLIKENKDTGLLLEAVKAGNMLLVKIEEKSLVDALIFIFTDRIQLTPEMIQANPQLAEIFADTVNSLSLHTEYAFSVFNKNARDYISIAAQAGPEIEEKINNLLFVASFINEDKFIELAALIHQKDVAEFKDSDSNANVGKLEIKEALSALSQLSDKNPSEKRLEGKAKLSNLPGKFYLNPTLLRLIRQGLTDPNEQIRIASANAYGQINSRLIYHRPNTNIDVELLSSGLNNPSVNFQERLARIEALGHVGDAHAVKPLIEFYYALRDLYSFKDRGQSVKENERIQLSRAVASDLLKMADSTSEIRSKLASRLNIGIFAYEDSELLVLLEKINPGNAEEVKSRMGHTALASIRDPLSVTKLYPPKDNTEIDRIALEGELSAYNKALVEARQNGEKKIPITDRAQAMQLLFSQDSEIGIAAAFYFVNNPDAASLGALNDAFKFASSDQLRAAAILRALGRFQSIPGAQCLRYPAFQEAASLAPEKQYIRLELAYQLGSSGDPRIVSVIQGLLKAKDNTTQVLAADSAFKVINILAGDNSDKSKDLTISILECAEDNYHFPGDRRVPIRGEEFNVAGQAEFDGLVKMAQDKDKRFHSILDAAIETVAITNYGKQHDHASLLAALLHSFWYKLHPVEEKLLNIYNHELLGNLKDKLGQMQSQDRKAFSFWAEFVAAVLGLGLFIKKTFSGKNRWYKEIFPQTPHKPNNPSNPVHEGNNDRNKNSVISEAGPATRNDPTPNDVSGSNTSREIMMLRALDLELKELYLNRAHISLNDRDIRLRQIALKVLDILMRYDWDSAEFQEARNILRNMHPDHLQRILDVSKEPPFNNNARLQKDISDIAGEERSSWLHTGVVRANGYINEWERLLERKKNTALDREDLTYILYRCRRIREVLPFRFAPELNKNIGDIKEIMEQAYSLIKRTNIRLNNQKGIKKEDYDVDVRQLVEYGHEFISYLGALRHAAEIHRAKDYGDDQEDYGENGNGNDNGNGGNGRIKQKVKYDIWHRLTAVKYMADTAIEEIKPLLEKINTEGNNGVTPEQYYANLKPVRTDSDRLWNARKEVLFLASGLLALFTVLTLWKSISFTEPTFNAFFWPLVKIISKASAGFSVVIIGHFWFVRMIFSNIRKDLAKRHRRIDKLEKEWNVYKLSNKQAIQQEITGSGSSSPIVAQQSVNLAKAASGLRAAPGGIDLRAIDFTVKQLPAASGESAKMKSGDKFLDTGVEQEISEMNRLIKAKIIPSGERLKECLKKIPASDRVAYFNQLNNCLANIFMLEEEYVQPSEASFVDALKIVVLNR